jgi:hypothetical protein
VHAIRAYWIGLSCIVVSLVLLAALYMPEIATVLIAVGLAVAGVGLTVASMVLDHKRKAARP